MINKCPPSSVSSTFRVDYLPPTIFLALAVFGTTAIWPPYLMYVVSNVVQGAVGIPRCRLLVAKLTGFQTILVFAACFDWDIMHHRSSFSIDFQWCILERKA